MAKSVRPFLMFPSKAEEALRFYVSVFPRSEVTEVRRYVKGEQGVEGTVMKALFSVGGQSVLCTDAVVKHAFTFTPAFSFFVECDSVEELKRVTETLVSGGTTLMPVGDYGFSKLFAWVNDRYGVSWQLNFG
ncbi:MAG: VOC family protein [Archangium sp.]|nr:VOC family protein [Archangium sp.]